MSRFPPPDGDPDALRAAARQLAAVADDLERAGARVGAAGDAAGRTAAPAWTGTASLAMTARALDVDELCHGRAVLAHGLADATAAYAARVSAARDEVEALNQAHAQAHVAAEDALLVLRPRAGPGVDPAAESRTAAEVRAVTHRLLLAEAAAEERHAEVLRELRRHAYDFEAAIREWDPLAGFPRHLQGPAVTFWLAKEVRGEYRQARQLGGWLAALRGTAAAAPSALRWATGGGGPGDADAWRRAVDGLRRADRAREDFIGLRNPAPRRPGVVAAGQRILTRAALPMTVANGAADAVLGGGYSGMRGAATRGFGVAGSLGAGALIAGGTALGPVGAAVAGSAVLAYGLWSVGNMGWDNRREVSGFLNGVIRGVHRVATGTGRAVVRTLAVPVAHAARGGLPASRRVLPLPSQVVPVTGPPLRPVPIGPGPQWPLHAAGSRSPRVPASRP